MKHHQLNALLGVITGRSAPALPPTRPDPRRTLEDELLANTEALRQQTLRLQQQAEEFGDWLARFNAAPSTPNRPTSRGA